MASLGHQDAWGCGALLLMLVASTSCQPSKFDAPEDRSSPGVDAGAVDASSRDADTTPARDAGLDALAPAPVDTERGDAATQDAISPGSDAESADAATAAPEDAAAAPTDADAAAPPDAAVTDPAPVTLRVRLSDDRDDTVWVNKGDNGPLEELLHFGPADGSPTYALEVGADSELCQTGLRFALDVPPSARIVSANLSMLRVGWDTTADPVSTMRVFVFESTELALFDPSHMHLTSSQHAPAGIWGGASVGGYIVGASNTRTTSPDLTVLVQHAVDQAGFRRGGHIGLLLVVDAMARDKYAQFRDSFESTDGPVLTVTYRP